MPDVTTVDPATGQPLATYPGIDVDAALGVLSAVDAAQPAWAARPVEERAELVRAVGAQLRKQAGDLAVAHQEQSVRNGDVLALRHRSFRTS